MVELSPIVPDNEAFGAERLLGERPQPCGQEADADEPKVN